MLKINKHCYWLNLVGFDFIALPTLKMHGQTQIKSNRHCIPTTFFLPSVSADKEPNLPGRKSGKMQEMSVLSYGTENPSSLNPVTAVM
jgi:hypothetical protein